MADHQKQLRNRGIGVDGYGAVSSRIFGGKRCLHLRLEVSTRGGKLLRYTHRLDGKRRDELAEIEGQPLIGGMHPDAFEARAAEREALHRQRGDWQAPVFHMWIELPLEMDAPAWGETMAQASQYFADRGHANAWAVHCRNERNENQPHGHMAILASQDACGTKRPIEGGGEMKAFRHHVATIINRVAANHGIQLAAEWTGENFKEMGVGRVPRTRLPMALYKAREDREAGNALSESRARLADAADRIEATWEWGQTPAGAAIKAQRKEDRAKAEGLVPEAVVDLHRARGNAHLRQLEQARQELEEAKTRVEELERELTVFRRISTELSTIENEATGQEGATPPLLTTRATNRPARGSFLDFIAKQQASRSAAPSDPSPSPSPSKSPRPAKKMGWGE